MKIPSYRIFSIPLIASRPMAEWFKDHEGVVPNSGVTVIVSGKNSRGANALKIPIHFAHFPRRPDQRSGWRSYIHWSAQERNLPSETKNTNMASNFNDKIAHKNPGSNKI